ncbi:MAG: thioredoxin-dependent thiol peroxidase [Saprospiraceae bacterium]
MLKAGDTIPEFHSILQNGNTISSNDFEGKKIALYFYPQDNTPTCTEEACNLRDNYHELVKRGFRVIGVSPDSLKKHTNFIKKFNLPFDLISDPDLKLIRLFGVWGPKKLFGRVYDGVLRTTFIIEDRKIVRVIDAVVSKSHATQIVEEDH